MVGNDLLMQFQADLLGVPVIRPKVAETTSLGAALRRGLRDRLVEHRGRAARELGRGQAVGADDGRRQARRVLQVLEARRDASPSTGSTPRARRPTSRWGGRLAPARPVILPAPCRHPQDRRPGHRRRRHRRRASRGTARCAATTPSSPTARDLAEGTSGRFHGLLHSGGRYVGQGPARRRRVRRGERRSCGAIAADCIEDTGGLFVTTPDDDPAYGDRFLEGCARAPACRPRRSTTAEALRREPRLNPGIKRAFTVPDA